MDLMLEKSFPALGETPLGAENSFLTRWETLLPAKISFPDPPDIPLGAENDWLQNEGVDAGLENHPFTPADAVFVVIRGSSTVSHQNSTIGFKAADR